MAHPKSKISKQRKRKRRTHYKAETPNVNICQVTSEPHLWHRAYYYEGDLFYKGKMIVKNSLEE